MQKEIRIPIQYRIIKKNTQINKNWIDTLIILCDCGLKPHS